MLRPVLATATAACALLLAPVSVKTASATCPAQFLPSTIAPDADCIFRDYSVDGVPSSGRWNPSKSDMRHWGEVIGSKSDGYIEVSDFGVVGDGSTNNNAAEQAAATAASVNGGNVHFGCGKFKTTAQVVQNITNNTGVTWQGLGPCTIIYASGTNAVAFNFEDLFSSGAVRDMIFATDSNLGLYTAVTWNQTSTSTKNFGPLNLVENVGYQGYDFGGAQTQYWGLGFDDEGVSGINFFGGTCNGTGRTGKCFRLAGSGTGTFTSAVQINFFGTSIQNCNVGLDWGPLVEGVAWDAVNVTGCHYAMQTQTETFGTAGDQFSVVNSQMNTDVLAIDIEDQYFVDIIFNGDEFITSGGTAIHLQGDGFLISNNAGSSTNSNQGYFLDVISTYGTGGIVSGNDVGNYKAGFRVGPGNVNAQVKLFENKWDANGVGAGATATATQSGGVVTALTLTAGGNGYTFTPNLVIQGNACAGVTGTATLTTSVTLTAALVAASSGTLSANWPGVTGNVSVTFSDGSVRAASFTNGSTAVTWTGAVTAGPTVSMATVTGLTLTSGGSGCAGAPTVGIQESEKYSIDPTSGGVLIGDDQPMAFNDAPLCAPGPSNLLFGSRITMINAQPETYNSPLFGGGNGIFDGLCAGGWLAH